MAIKQKKYFPIFLFYALAVLTEGFCVFPKQLCCCCGYDRVALRTCSYKELRHAQQQDTGTVSGNTFYIEYANPEGLK